MELKTIQLPSVQGHTVSFASDCRGPALSIYRIPLRFTSRPQLFPIWTDPKPQSIQDGGIHGSPPTVSCVWLCKQLFCFSGGHGDEANGAVHSWPNLSDLCNTWPPAVHGASRNIVTTYFTCAACGRASGGDLRHCDRISVRNDASGQVWRADGGQSGLDRHRSNSQNRPRPRRACAEAFFPVCHPGIAADR